MLEGPTTLPTAHDDLPTSLVPIKALEIMQEHDAAT